MKFDDLLESKKDIKYRIVLSNGKVKYAGTGHDSWFTLDRAKRLVNTKAGESIYEYDPNTQERMWEVL